MNLGFLIILFIEVSFCNESEICFLFCGIDGIVAYFGNMISVIGCFK